jgi:hypothetical protein
MRSGPAAAPARIADLLEKGACPVCSALKIFQKALLTSPRTMTLARLCNYHAWLLAKSAPGVIAAGSLLRALQSLGQGAPGDLRCGLCRSIHQEEAARVAELAQAMQRSSIRTWMRDQGSLCARHARALSGQLPPDRRDDVSAIIERTAKELSHDLELFLNNSRRGLDEGAGILGRAAEFLVAQRGIIDEEDLCSKQDPPRR